LRRCPYFDKCDEIWGRKSSIHVPFTASSEKIGIPPTPTPDISICESPVPTRVEENSDNELESWNLNNIEEEFPSSIPLSEDEESQILPSTSTDNETSNSQSSTKSTRDSNVMEKRGKKSHSATDSQRSKILKAGDKLAHVGKHTKSSQDVYEEAVLARERNLTMKLELQEKQFKLDQDRVNASSLLERERFEYQKLRDSQMLESEKIKLEAEREMTARKRLEIEELQLRLELARHTNN
jgi:hypothetical protein